MPDTYKTEDNENFSAGGSTPTQVNHIIWQGLPGVYLAATNNGPMKSVDGGLTWDYIRPNATFGTTWPAGAVGRQMSFGVGPRECPPENTDNCVCEDFESGLGNWTFTGSGTHELVAGPSPRTSQSLHTNEGVSFTRLPISITPFDPTVVLSLYVYNTNFHDPDGSFTIQISPYTMSFTLEWYWNHPNTWHLNGNALSTDALVDGQWNYVALTFNRYTGQMLTLTINNTVEDISTISAPGDYSQETFDIVIDTFAPLPALGGEFYFDDICICNYVPDPFQNGFNLWGFTGASASQNMGFDDLIEGDVVVIWGHIGQIDGSTPGETPVPTAPGFTFTKRLESVAFTTEKEVIWTATAPAGVDPAFLLTMTFPTDDNSNGSQFSVARGRGITETPVQAVSDSGNSANFSLTMADFANSLNYGLAIQVSGGYDLSTWQNVDNSPFLWDQGGPGPDFYYSIAGNWMVLGLEFGIA